MVAFLDRLFHWLFVLPLSSLLRGGPAPAGFFENAHPSDICYSVTGVSSDHWIAHPDRCDRVIEDKARSYAVLAAFLLYGYCLAQFCAALPRLLWALVFFGRKPFFHPKNNKDHL